jgi:hypothetical protein
LNSPTPGNLGLENGIVIVIAGAITRSGNDCAVSTFELIFAPVNNLVNVALMGRGTAGPGSCKPDGVIDTGNPAIFAAEISNEDDGVTFPLASSVIVAVDFTSPNVNGPTVKPCISVVAVDTTEDPCTETDADDETKATFPKIPVCKPPEADACDDCWTLFAASWYGPDPTDTFGAELASDATNNG